MGCSRTYSPERGLYQQSDWGVYADAVICAMSLTNMGSGPVSSTAGLYPCCCHLLQELCSLFKISLFLASLISCVALVSVSLSRFASNFYLLLRISLIGTASAHITELDLVYTKCGGIGRGLLVIWKIRSPKLFCVPISCVSPKLHGSLASGLIACQTSQQIKSISHHHPQLSRHLVFVPAGIFRKCLQLSCCL